MPRINLTRFTGIHIETTANPNRSNYYRETTSALDEFNNGHAGSTVIRNIEATCEMNPGNGWSSPRQIKAWKQTCLGTGLDVRGRLAILLYPL
jgi:hypothetical protein